MKKTINKVRINAAIFFLAMFFSAYISMITMAASVENSIKDAKINQGVTDSDFGPQGASRDTDESGTVTPAVSIDATETGQEKTDTETPEPHDTDQDTSKSRVAVPAAAAAGAAVAAENADKKEEAGQEKTDSGSKQESSSQSSEEPGNNDIDESMIETEKVGEAVGAAAATAVAVGRIEDTTQDEGSISGDIFEKNRSYLHGFFSVAESYTTNLYKTDKDPESCWATFLTPGIWAAVPSTTKRSVEIITANASPGGLAINPFNPSDKRPFQAYLLYSPQFEFYHNKDNSGIFEDQDVKKYYNQDSLDRTTHRMDAYLSYHSGNMLFLRAMDQYKISYDAFSERAYFIEDKYKSNLFNIAGTLDATHKLRLRLDYSNFDLNYTDKINSNADRTDNSIAAYLFFRLTAKTSAFVEYEFADINYDTSDKDSQEHRYFAGLRWEMTGKSSGQIKGGFGEKTFDTTTSILPDTDLKKSDISESNWMAEIQIDHNFNSRTNLTLNAYRRYDEVLEHRYDYGDFQNFYADYTLAHFFGFRINRDISSKIHLFLDTSFFLDEFKGSHVDYRPGYDEERKDTEFAVSPSINFDIYKWMTLNAAYIYTDHDSNYPGHDYIDHTFFVRASLFL
ncbi:MAG: outer membrane beta-barrel protein [Desulfobacteraceae bacterium]|nr:outer membrane beta-barrel protein [Desulfobacteraceae bacterium]MBC2758182.1 outer membrane beta-barrel protein [Desulfobacteraceae bacterium]